MTVIKCAFWGEKLLAANVKNWGYRDWNFEVVMAGSNGYNKGQPEQRSEATKSAVAKCSRLLVATLVLPVIIQFASLMVSSLVVI